MGEIDLLVSQIPASVFFFDSRPIASRAIILSKSVLPKCISTPLHCACIPCALAPSVCVCVCVCTCVCWCACVFVCVCVCVCLCMCVCVKWPNTVPPPTFITTPFLCVCIPCVLVCLSCVWCVGVRVCLCVCVCVSMHVCVCEMAKHCTSTHLYYHPIAVCMPCALAPSVCVCVYMCVGVCLFRVCTFTSLHIHTSRSCKFKILFFLHRVGISI